MENMVRFGWFGRIFRKIQERLTKMGTMEMSKAEVAAVIEGFLDHTQGPWDWDDFLTSTLADPDIDRVRIICFDVHDLYPPGEEGGYCSEEGIKVLRNLVKELRQSDSDLSS